MTPNVQQVITADENSEVMPDLQESIHLLRSAAGRSQISKIVEKGFFIDSLKSLPLQLCDLRAYSARRPEEKAVGITVRESLVYGVPNTGSERERSRLSRSSWFDVKAAASLAAAGSSLLSGRIH